jgi:hypothetical protein
MAGRILLSLLMLLTASSEWGAVALLAGNGRDWTVGQYTDDHTRKIQCLMRWDSGGRTFTYAIFKDGAVMSFRKTAWCLPQTMAETSITLDGKPVSVQRLDDKTLGMGWGANPSPMPTILFNAFIQSGKDMIVSFDIDETPWVISFPLSDAISDSWVKCLSRLDDN